MSQRPVAGGAVRWLDVELPTVAENLALDEALLAEAHDGEFAGTVVRSWMAAEHAVVLGSSSHVSAEVDLAACDAAGVVVVRRPSGGLTVAVGPGCLMWSVVATWPEPAPAIDALHAAFLDPLAAALGAAGRAVVRRGSSDLALDVAGCLRKVSGNALRVRRQAVLYHGTLLDDFDLALVSRVLRHPPREPEYRGGRDHGSFLANLRLGRRPLEQAVRQAFAAAAERHDWPRERVAELVRQRYRDGGWTHRLS